MRTSCATAIDEVLVAERLLQEIEGPVTHGFHRHGDVAVAGNEDHRDDCTLLVQGLLQLEAAHAGHADIEHETARLMGVGGTQYSRSLKSGVKEFPQVATEACALRAATLCAQDQRTMACSIVRKFTWLALVAALSACAGDPNRLESPRDAAVGARIYKVSCAACHGADARGTGPVAPLLTVPVPDLTRIAQRRGGEFPELEIFRIIDGQSEMASHGARHMPVWGYEFFGDDEDDEVAHRRATDKVDRLVAYLRSIQRID